MAKPPEIKVNYKIQYFLFQLIGWGFLVALIAVFNVKQEGFSVDLFLFLTSVFFFNLSISHLYRLFVNSRGWLHAKLNVLLFRIGVSSTVLGVVFSVIINTSNGIVFETSPRLLSLNDWLFGSFIYFIWNLLYFGYLLFYKARIIEFKNIQLQALNAQTELKNLRSQLNPHFMFNAMNSIRALIDENPSKSKTAVTQLSNVLRNSLIHTKKELVSLKEEMTIVSDYLSLEKIRYEERLRVRTEISNEALSAEIPPLLIQTLVENAIKHGISKLKEGGDLYLSAKLVDGFLEVVVTNPGILQLSKESTTQIGMENTQKRLELLYGKSAVFSLTSSQKKVIARISIPLIPDL